MNEEASLPQCLREGDLDVMLGTSLFRNPADIRQASPPFGIGVCAIAAAPSFLSHDLFHDRRPPVLFHIPADIFSRVAETVPNVLTHERMTSSSIIRDSD
jgi:hypothetical protein